MLKPKTVSFQPPQDFSASLSFDVDRLWLDLESETKVMAYDDPVAFLYGKERPLSRFGYLCPKNTAVCVNGQYLNAHRVGEGMTRQAFVASQAPLKTSRYSDYNEFWRAVFDSDYTIFDLTTLTDKKYEKELEKVTEYCPPYDELMQCGSLSITLAGKEIVQPCSAWLHTYEITDQETQQRKIYNDIIIVYGLMGTEFLF